MEDKIYCKECCKEISEETSKQYKGYCKSCYDDRFNSSSNDSSLNVYHKISILYFIIIIISSIVAGNNIPTGSYSDFNMPVMFVILFTGFISFFLFFMLATIIEELRNNRK